MSRRDLFNLCSIPAVFVAGPAGMAIREVTELALPMEFMKFSRDAEREADLLGMEYAYAAGYDPAEMVNFFEKVQAEEKHRKGFLARAFDTHPMTAERVQRAQEEMTWMLPAKDDYVVTTSEFSDVKARLSAIVNHHLLLNAPPDKPVLRKSVEDDGPPVLKKNSGK
jgi:beta-barrel assembly-enhancing protease